MVGGYLEVSDIGYMKHSSSHIQLHELFEMGDGKDETDHRAEPSFPASIPPSPCARFLSKSALFINGSMVRRFNDLVS